MLDGPPDEQFRSQIDFADVFFQPEKLKNSFSITPKSRVLKRIRTNTQAAD